MKVHRLVLAGLLGGVCASGKVECECEGATYKDAGAAIDDRVADLVARMSTREKMAQLIQGDVSNWMNTTTGAINTTGLEENMDKKAGQFYVGYPVSWDMLAHGIKVGQQYLMENTSLQIPALVQTEAIHGFLLQNATLFNSPIAYACSWDTELISEMAEIIAQEARAFGVSMLFAPVVNLARELRFGRVAETFGEDPYLSGEIGYTFAKKLQDNNVSATVKHWVPNFIPENGENLAPIHGGPRELRRTFLPPFKRAIIDAEATSIMSGYTSYDGIPSTSDYTLLTQLLRGEWGYQYHVTSDAGATDNLCTLHGLCYEGDKEAVTMLTLPAGNDVEMGGGSFNFETIPDLIDSGVLSMDVVDTAVSRVLRSKFKIGLFEDPYANIPVDNLHEVVHTQSSIDLARELDASSIVLLENHDDTLPINPDECSNIAVIGPMSDFMNYGDYVVQGAQYESKGVTPLAGIQKAAQNTSMSISFAQGCERWSNDQSGFDEAVEVAQKADVAVVFVGTWSRDQYELWAGYNATTGEHLDVASLDLVGAQAPLVRKIKEVAKKTIVVFSSGKPVTEPWISDEVDALVQQFYPGEQGGNAIADILFGKHNPSGRLSVSFPHDVGTLPVYQDYLKGGRPVAPGHAYANGTLMFGSDYVLDTPAALYPFGYGMSYSNFTHSNISLTQTNYTKSDTVPISIKVTNHGQRDGSDVVQVYVKDVVASVVTPVRELKGFKKVKVPAGQTVDVTIPIQISELGLWNQSMQYVVEPGEFSLMAGTDSNTFYSTTSIWVS